MRKSQKLFLLLAIVIMFSALTGCSGNKKEVEEFIEQYVEDIVNGKWDQVLQKSTVISYQSTHNWFHPLNR